MKRKSGELALSYDDICLIPRYSELSTRSLAVPAVNFGGNFFELPIIPANMRCCIDPDLAKKLSKKSYMYIMHRFDVEYEVFVKKANEESWPVVSISVGVSQSDIPSLENIAIRNYKLDYITLDVAHGHSKLVKDTLYYLRKKFPDSFIIAGNVATPKAVADLEKWGASAVKVGIGGGSPCSTKYKTGFTNPMFTCISECACAAGVPIIADGGIRHNGDIAKALVAGASMVMCGGLFVACKDSPAETINIPCSTYAKRYFGSASLSNKSKNSHIEGFTVDVEGNGMTYFEKLNEISEDLSSAISYAGGEDLAAFNRVQYRQVT